MRALLRLTAAALAFSLAACDRAPSGNASVPQPAKPVDLTRYAGKWYEVARYDSLKYEQGCEGVTAEYSRRPDGLIRVVNTCRQGGLEGPVKVSEGKARIEDVATNAKLKVSFFGPFFVGDYWVLDHADDYSWAIVGEPSGKYLWLLMRKPPSDLEREALAARAQALGYDGALLRQTKQPTP